MEPSKKEIVDECLHLLNNESTEDSDSSSSSSSSSSSEENVRREHFKVTHFVEVIDQFTEKDFKSHMRLTKDTVDYLITRYSQSNPDTITNPGNPKTTAKAKIYMYIWYISNTVTFRQLGNLFGVAKSSAWTSVRTITNWIISISHEFLRWPKRDEVQETCNKFEQKAKIPGVLGAIDCTHIVINAPLVSKECYFGRNRDYSVVLQAVVDAEKKFLNVYCGEPGSLHDSRVLRRSLLFSEAENNKESVFPNSTFLLGDSAYPSKSWLVPTFKNNANLSPAQRRFNCIHSETRIVVENAFGLLKGRFRRLLHFTEQRDLCSVTNLVVSACVLSNLCILRYDLWDESEETESTAETTDVIETDEREHGANRREILMNELLEKQII